MSLAQLRAQGRMWILTRFRLQMDRYPFNGDLVTVETWASSRTNGIRAVRQFQFSDVKSNVLGRASSIFLLMDCQRKRPIRLPKAILNLAHAERSDPDEFEVPRLKAPEQIDRTAVLKVRWRDLDANDHANNVSYVDWALEALPVALNRDGMLRQLDIEFLAEAFYGDDVISEVEMGEVTCRHRLISGQGNVLGLAATRWA